MRLLRVKRPRSTSRRMARIHSNLRDVALKSVTHGISAVGPAALVTSAITMIGGKLKIGDWQSPLNEIDSILVVGAGKANGGMARAVLDVFDATNVKVIGTVNIPHGQPFPTKLTS